MKEELNDWYMKIRHCINQLENSRNADKPNGVLKELNSLMRDIHEYKQGLVVKLKYQRLKELKTIKSEVKK